MIGLLLLAANVSTAPGFYNGADLYRFCKQDPGGACLTYIIGVSDEIDTLVQLGALSQPVCPPPKVTAAQERDIVVRFLEQTPEARNQSAASLTMAAPQNAFPCAGQQPG